MSSLPRHDHSPRAARADRGLSVAASLAVAQDGQSFEMRCVAPPSLARRVSVTDAAAVHSRLPNLPATDIMPCLKFVAARSAVGGARRWHEISNPLSPGLRSPTGGRVDDPSAGFPAHDG